MTFTKFFLPAILFLIFSTRVNSLTIPVADSGSILSYEDKFLVENSLPLTVGEIGGKGGIDGTGYSSFDHGYCRAELSWCYGDVMFGCNLPKTRNLKGSLLVTKAKLQVSCNNYSRSGVYIGPFYVPCTRQQLEWSGNPIRISELSATAQIITKCKYTVGAHVFASSGKLEYVGGAYRSFFKFPVHDLNYSISSAKLKFEIKNKINDFGKEEGQIEIHHISDFGSLDKGDFFQNENIINSFDNNFSELDVTEQIILDINEGKTFSAFMLKNSIENFNENSRYFIIQNPVLEVSFNSQLSESGYSAKKPVVTDVSFDITNSSRGFSQSNFDFSTTQNEKIELPSSSKKDLYESFPIVPNKPEDDLERAQPEKSITPKPPSFLEKFPVLPVISSPEKQNSATVLIQLFSSNIFYLAYFLLLLLFVANQILSRKSDELNLKKKLQNQSFLANELGEEA